MKKLSSISKKNKSGVWVGGYFSKNLICQQPWAMKYKVIFLLIFCVSCNRQLTNLTNTNEMQVLLKDKAFPWIPPPFHYLISIASSHHHCPRACVQCFSLQAYSQSLQFIHHPHFIGGKTEAKVYFDVGWRPHSAPCFLTPNHFPKISIRLPLPALSAEELNWDLRASEGTS